MTEAKCAAKVGEHLMGLGCKVTQADEVALGVLGFLASDEYRLASGRDDDMGVGRWTNIVLPVLYLATIGPEPPDLLVALSHSGRPVPEDVERVTGSTLLNRFPGTLVRRLAWVFLLGEGPCARRRVEAVLHGSRFRGS
jgi:hypothetical protein